MFQMTAPTRLVTPGGISVGVALAQAKADRNVYFPGAALVLAQYVPELGAVAAGRVTPPAGGRRIYLSRGLAGTEVALLAAISAAAVGR